MDASEIDPIVFHYRFDFKDGSSKIFDVRLDRETLALIDRPTGPPPAWTRLDTCRCANCPLAGKATHCPVAVNLVQVVESFRESVSFEYALVTVRTEHRTYQKPTTVQRGLSSIIGIYNVTSNCPILDKLRPMVRFHLPFASTEETMYRALSMYLVGQVFTERRGGTPDWSLDGLDRIYEAISYVEEGLSARFRHASENDANPNAITILSVFRHEIRYMIGEGLRGFDHWFPPETPGAA
jgi:hypothetical protein